MPAERLAAAAPTGGKTVRLRLDKKTVINAINSRPLEVDRLGRGKEGKEGREGEEGKKKKREWTFLKLPF